MNFVLADLKHPNIPLSIVAPVGGFGNHLRWLILMSREYSFRLCPTLKSYSTVAKLGWPRYDDYCRGNLEGIDSDIAVEIQRSTMLHNFVDDADKLNFIKSSIYYDARSWHNWLATEWQFRASIDPLIDFKHDIDSIDPARKYIVSIIDPMIALRAYLKFNSSLNNVSAEDFLNRIRTFNNKTELWLKENVFIFDSSDLIRESLNQKVYSDLLSWIGISENYDNANLIHGIWYRLHQKAEKEFLVDINNFYKSRTLWRGT